MSVDSRIVTPLKIVASQKLEESVDTISLRLLITLHHIRVFTGQITQAVRQQGPACRTANFGLKPLNEGMHDVGFIVDGQA